MSSNSTPMDEVSEHLAPEPAGLRVPPPRRPVVGLLADITEHARLLAREKMHVDVLLVTNAMIADDTPLPVILRHIAEAACQIMHAPSGALAVFTGDGGLAHFVNAGRTRDAVSTIDPAALGDGLLRELIQTSADSEAHPRGADVNQPIVRLGNHPSLGWFYGVPIRVRGAVSACIYLLLPEDNQIDADDEKKLSSLAVVAGVAIENAHLLDVARQRERWLLAATASTSQLLPGATGDSLATIAGLISQAINADAVNVLLLRSNDQLVIEVAMGAGAAELSSYGRSEGETFCEQVIDRGEPVRIDDVRAERLRASAPDGTLVDFGPLIALPLVGPDRIRGVLVLGRLRGRAPFTDDDVQMATPLANHAALALELADARAAQNRVADLQIQNTRAHELHDHLIQRLFGTGMTVQSVAANDADTGARTERLKQVVDDVDQTIRELRTSIALLRGQSEVLRATD